MCAMRPMHPYAPCIVYLNLCFPLHAFQHAPRILGGYALHVPLMPHVFQVQPQLAVLLPNLANIMRSGRDASQTLPLVESYLLLGSAAQ